MDITGLLIAVVVLVMAAPEIVAFIRELTR